MDKKPWGYTSEIWARTQVDPYEAAFIEGYALALSEMMRRLSGEGPCEKSYDPMFIEGNVAHSYAFNMKDGGRHHDLTLYKDVGEILDSLTQEAIDWVEEGYEEMKKALEVASAKLDILEKSLDDDKSFLYGVLQETADIAGEYRKAAYIAMKALDYIVNNPYVNKKSMLAVCDEALLDATEHWYEAQK